MEDRQGVNAKNGLCVLVGRPGIDPLAVVGPFDDETAAQQEADARKKAGAPQAVVDILVNPANLED